MINDIIENITDYCFILKLTANFLIFWYIIRRLMQKRFQKKVWLNNFEFYVYREFVDYFKFNGYPYPEKRAFEEINIFKNKIKKECTN